MSNSIPIYQLSKVKCGVDYNSKSKNFEYLYYIFEIYSDGHLHLANAQKNINLMISLKKIMVQMKEIVKSYGNKDPNTVEILLFCQGVNGQRLTVHIMTDDKVKLEIIQAMHEVSTEHNLDQFLLSHQQENYREEHLPSHPPPPAPEVFTPPVNAQPEPPAMSQKPSSAVPQNLPPSSQKQSQSTVPPSQSQPLSLSNRKFEPEIHAQSIPEQIQLQANAQSDLEEAQDVIVYKNDRLYFSAIRERNFRFAVVWKPWAARTVILHSDGILTYNKPKRSGEVPKHKTFNCQNIEVTLMGDDEQDDVDFGLIVKCYTMDGLETYFRCILDEQELDNFLTALKSVALNHNIDSLVRSQLTVEKKKKRFYILRSKQSVMRRAVTRAMDKFDLRSKRERIISKRGTMKWLPVAGSNDLIHGSWWFVIGSIGAVITSVVVLQNKTKLIWNEDDSTLTTPDYIATWVLMCISGIFSTLGSLAFVRAFHENPPMSPLFPNWYHLQSDELLASWLFFLATIPFVPYCGIYLAEARFRDLSYLVALVLSILATCGTLLFARACYPTEVDKPHRDLLLPMSKLLCCCCCSEKKRQHYFMNDWLGGSWYFFWATEAATFGTFILFAIALGERNGLQIFMYGTSFVEMLCFLLGSAYFVAGSYPEGYATNLAMSGEEGQGYSGHYSDADNNESQRSAGDYSSRLHQPNEVYNPLDPNYHQHHNTNTNSNNVKSNKVILPNDNVSNNYDYDDMELTKESIQKKLESEKKPMIFWSSQKKAQHQKLTTQDLDEDTATV